MFFNVCQRIARPVLAHAQVGALPMATETAGWLSPCRCAGSGQYWAAPLLHSAPAPSWHLGPEDEDEAPWVQAANKAAIVKAAIAIWLCRIYVEVQRQGMCGSWYPHAAMANCTCITLQIHRCLWVQAGRVWAVYSS